jgi:hypothetical protein
MEVRPMTNARASVAATPVTPHCAHPHRPAPPLNTHTRRKSRPQTQPRLSPARTRAGPRSSAFRRAPARAGAARARALPTAAPPAPLFTAP